ncbi:MAG: hypothetical protein K2Q24_01425 [Chitinophagaceae bacterium]|nr:hypothetical protein [Chitinophagaceae bacterium]
MLNKKNSLKLSLFFMAVFLIGCFGENGHDPDLFEPDTDNSGLQKGYNYTDLGMLVSFPWRIAGERKDTSAKVNLSTFESNIESHVKASLFFELNKDGSASYWFMEDYIEGPVDTIRGSDSMVTINIKVRRSKDLKLKHIYSDAKWSYNKTDSAFEINFGKNDFNLEPIKGKIYDLNTDMFCIVSSSPVKQGNTMENFTITTCFSHY